jgi:hypothetical protein
MKLSPEWLPDLEQVGWQACHWSDVGFPTAPDTDFLAWARQHGRFYLRGHLPAGEFAQVRIVGHAGCDSIAESV